MTQETPRQQRPTIDWILDRIRETDARMFELACAIYRERVETTEEEPRRV